MTDSVNHPAHYGTEDDPYEVIKVAEAWGFDGDAYLFNVLKYVRRDKENELEDLKKARFYLDRKIARMEAVEAEHTKAFAEPVQEAKPANERRVPVEVYSGDDPFSGVCVMAEPDWPLWLLAKNAAGAAGYGVDAGPYGISLSPAAKPLAQASVDALLHAFPQPQHRYYLHRPDF